MTLIDALRAGNKVRRPVAKHWGSNRSGWLDREWVKNHLTGRNRPVGTWHEAPLIDEVDLMADDWEAKND